MYASRYADNYDRYIDNDSTELGSIFSVLKRIKPLKAIANIAAPFIPGGKVIQNAADAAADALKHGITQQVRATPAAQQVEQEVTEQKVHEAGSQLLKFAAIAGLGLLVLNATRR